ncbi:MAG: DUF2784 domain-containing protein [Gammaproteobacteria bacterium]|nr:DUF2784 domain-containing protein [Gammaproteobacteria bacterium]
MTNIYQLAADAVLVVHASIVFFIVAGLLLIVFGGIFNWQFILNRPFRILHLVAIGVVVAQAWLGRLCPLTILEMWLREQGGEASYEASFVQHWLQELLYYDFPLWVFAIAYTLFGLAVVASWFWIPPKSKSN